MRRNLTIGIVGGAGPMAGLLLAEQIIAICQQQYGCQRDGDFPQIMLYSYPFSEMLGTNVPHQLLENELQQALQLLDRNGVDLIAIACNTLHGFLPRELGLQRARLINLVDEAQRYLVAESITNPLLLCTSTTAKSRLYACDVHYPNADDQRIIDQIIDRILAGEISVQLADALRAVASKYSAKAVILGCTELSLLNQRCPLTIPSVDPLRVVAETLAYKSLISGKRS